MLAFPQEIVDMVIDQLADPLQPFEEYTSISWYSTVSRQWLERTQKYHFESVLLRGRSGLDKWRAAIEPDPDGVSRHVRRLTWIRINTLEGLDSHIRAFVCVEALAFEGCNLLLSPSVVESLAPMGSSLVKLTIGYASTTYSIITSLLAVLPRLRHLQARFLEFPGDRDTIGPPPKIPFFEDADSLDLLIEEDDDGSLDWIPASARFRDLRIDVASILNKSGRVKQWIASSARTLRFPSITQNPWSSPFSPLDLSGCTELESLQLTIWLTQPGVLAKIVIPSLYTFPPPKIVLVPTGSFLVSAGFRSVEAMGGHLCRAAKEFKATHSGRKMEVEISMGDWGCGTKPTFVEWCKSAEVMLKLMEDADVVVTNNLTR